MKIKSLLFLTGSLVSNIAHAGYFSEFDIFAYSEPISIYSVINNWEGDYRGGDNAVTHNKIEVGVSSGKWKYSLFNRYDYEIKIPDATAEFYYRVKNKLALQVGKTYPLSVSVSHTRSNGFRLAYQVLDDKSFSIDVGLSLLRGLTLTDGDISGSATAVSDKDYDFSFNVDYVYSKDQLFKRVVDSPSGYGFSSDLFIRYSPNRDVLFNLKIVDLLGLVYWLDAPRTVARAGSNNKTFDADGFVIYLPLVSGKESTRNYTQRLPTTIQLSSVINVKKVQLLSALYRTRVSSLYKWGLGLQGSLADTRLYYSPQTYAVSFELISTQWKFSVTADTLDRRRASIFELNFALHF